MEQPTDQLEERAHELKCLYEISHLAGQHDAALETLVQEIVELIPSGWSRPEAICARIRLKDHVFCTPNFAETDHHYANDIIAHGSPVGRLDVYRFQEGSGNDDGPFSQEKTRFLDAIATELARAVAYRETQDALLESQEINRVFLKGAVDAVTVLDADGTVVALNETSAQKVGRRVDELIGAYAFDIFPPDLAQARKTKISQVFHSAQPVQFTDERAGMTFDQRVYPILDACGTVKRVAVFSYDLTRQIEAEETLQQRNRELALLNQSAQAFSSTLDLDQILITVLDATRSLLGLVANSVWLIDPESGELVCQQATGPQNDVVRGWRLAPGEGLAGWTVRTGEGLIIADACKDERHSDGVVRKTGLALRSILTVPLQAKGKTIGVLQAVDSAIDRFSSKDLELLESLAASAAIAIENARLYKEAQDLRAFNENIIQSMNEGILVEDTSGRITFVNTSAAKMLGYGSEELIGKHWKTAISSDHLWLVEREAAKRSHGIASRYETVLSTRDGQSVPVIVSARPLFNEGQFAGVLAVFTDITELKKAEKALRESEARYRTISDLTSDFAYAFRVEPDGTLTREWTTEAFTHITGFSLEEIDRRGDWTRFVPSSDAATAQQPSELRIITKDGDTRWLSIRSRPVRNEEQGRIVRVVGAAQDITDRKQAEEAFIRRNRELTALNAIATILNQHLDPQKALNATVDRILEMVEASAGWIQLLDEETHTLRLIAYRGFSSQALTAIRSITLNTDASAIAHMGEDGILDQVARLTENVRLKDLDACTHIPIKAKERVLGILGIFSKQPCRIGPQKQQLLTAIAHQIGTAIENMQLAEEASEIEILRELSRLRSELVANVSHELRTPLGLIKFFVTSLLMEDANFDWDTRLKFLRGIDEEADRLEIIVDNLLDISRVESGRLRLDKRPTNVNQLVKEIVESMRIELELDPLFTRHHLAYDFPPTPLIASIDARRIEQVLRNLLSNAVKYSPEGGKITVQGHGNQNQIIIWVNDQGVGIPPQDLERVFERFYRVENEVTQQTRGAGLGLAVCRGIIEAHRGHIWADSVHGEGSVFYFTIPIDLSAP